MENSQAPQGRTDDRSETPSVVQQGMIFDSARGTAVKLLSRYESSDSYIDKLLEAELRRSELPAADRALVTELVNGCVRWQTRLDWILTGFYHGEFTKCLPIVKNALRIALYQMMFLSKIPPPAAINESVELVKRLKGERHAGIVNGVLRNVLRNIQNIRYPAKEENIVLHYSVLYSHPQWMVRRYLERFGEEQTDALLAANNFRPMLTLRVNTFKATMETVEAALREAEIKYEVSPIHPTSVQIASFRDIRSTPLFTEGLVTIQDASASLAVRLANPQPGMTVYDLCAAPGGKAIHAAELMKNTGTVIALEKYESKLHLIVDNAQRAGVSIVQPLHGDAREFEPGAQADLVLVDAPCSGMGTLSKKPDIKWRRSLDDIRQMARMQATILNHAAAMVAAGGALVYSTCTIELEENVSVVKDFLDRHPDFSLDDASAYVDASVVVDGTIQTFPHIHHSDGAFAARLVRARA